MSFELFVILMILLYLFGVSLCIALITMNPRQMNVNNQFRLLYISLIPIVQYFVIGYLAAVFVKSRKQNSDYGFEE